MITCLIFLAGLQARTAVNFLNKKYLNKLKKVSELLAYGMKSDIQGRLAVIAKAPVETANGYGRIFHH